MKRLLLALALLVASTAQAQRSSCDEFVPHGYPKFTTDERRDITPLCRISYFVAHDNLRKIPFFTAELLLPENVNVNDPRQNDFREDLSVPPHGRARNSDYAKSGYDRGHMAAANNMRAGSAAMSQSFYLSNMVPQEPGINRGIWKSLELQVIKWVKEGRELYVFTGPLTKDRTIGRGVAVPEYTWKLVVDVSRRDAIAFLIPNDTEFIRSNKPKNYRGPLLKMGFQIYVDDLERMTGLNFFPDAPLEVRQALIKSDGGTFRIR